ncbi:2-oxoacid:acceptor oxidoreductase family protein [bacterium]|jgi:2-oxoglutarate ferredoxin oxidoreductase subunit gamma|nr:2-oxoacid:acceptor oxidoreductase family protein [bacterium]
MQTDRLEIRVTGFGGQGVILTGYILGRAAALFRDQHAVLAQTYGPEARGSACRADLIVSPNPIDYPQVARPNILIALSQDGYTTHKKSIEADGMILYDEELVRPDMDSPVFHASIPATRFAKEVGHKIMANIVMLGFCTALTNLATAESMEKAVSGSVPKGTEPKNLNAFRKGYEYGQQWLESHMKGNGHKTSPYLRK